MAISILKKKEDYDISPISLCSSIEGKKTLFIGYGCQEYGYGGKDERIKQFVFSTVLNIEQDFTKLRSGQDEGLSCPKDSGGAYIIRDRQLKSSCLLSVNYGNDRKEFNYSTNVFSKKIRSWMKKIIEDNKVKICGLNKVCSNVFFENHDLNKKSE